MMKYFLFSECCKLNEKQLFADLEIDWKMNEYCTFLSNVIRAASRSAHISAPGRSAYQSAFDLESWLSNSEPSNIPEFFNLMHRHIVTSV